MGAIGWEPFAGAKGKEVLAPQTSSKNVQVKHKYISVTQIKEYDEGASKIVAYDYQSF